MIVLSLFPGIGLLDAAFEAEGFCVVRGPDLLWGGDVKRFHPPADVFDGVIGGPPCQAWSTLVPIIRACGKRIAEDLIPEFERIVAEARPRWFVMENVIRAPVARVHGYKVDPALLNNRWLGEKQNRVHRFSFGTRGGSRLRFDLAALESTEFAYRVTTDARQRPVRLLAGSIAKRPRLHHRLSHEGPVLTIEDMCELQGLASRLLRSLAIQPHGPAPDARQRRPVPDGTGARPGGQTCTSHRGGPDGPQAGREEDPVSAIDWPAMLAQLEQQRTALDQERQDIDAVIDTVRRRAGAVVPGGLTLPPTRSAKPARNGGPTGKRQDNISASQIARIRRGWEAGEPATAIAKAPELDEDLEDDEEDEDGYDDEGPLFDPNEAGR